MDFRFSGAIWWCCTSVPIQRLHSRRFCVASVDRSHTQTKHRDILLVSFFLSSVFISHANVAGIYELLCSCTLHKSIRSRNFKYKFKCDADFLFKFRLEHLPAKCEQMFRCVVRSQAFCIYCDEDGNVGTHKNRKLGNLNLWMRVPES